MKATVILWLFVLPLTLAAQQATRDNTNRFYPGLTTSVITGGEVSSRSFYFRSGYGMYASWNYRGGGLLSAAIQAGAEFLQEETFFPVSAQLHMYPLGTGRPSIFAEYGHAFATHDRFRYMTGYHFRGGALFGLGVSQELDLGPSSSLWLALKFKSQDARLDFSNDDGFRYTDELGYSLLSLSVGIRFYGTR